MSFEYRPHDSKSFALFHSLIALRVYIEQTLLTLKLWMESEVTNKTNANDNPGK